MSPLALPKIHVAPRLKPRRYFEELLNNVSNNEAVFWIVWKNDKVVRIPRALEITEGRSYHRWLKANMIATNTPFSPEVNVALVIFAIVVVVLALILAAIILTRPEKLGKRPGRAAILREPVAEPVSQSKVVSPIPPPAPAFEISNLRISPLKAKEGGTVTIAFSIAITGNDAGDYSAEFQVDGSIVAVERVALDPGIIKLVSCTVTGFDAGEHEVRVGGLEGKFVLPEADIGVTALDINPRQAKEREKVTVIAEVTNNSGVTGTHKLELRLGGVFLAAQEFSVAPRVSQKVFFYLRNLKPGVYRIAIGNISSTFVVGMENHHRKIPSIRLLRRDWSGTTYMAVEGKKGAIVGSKWESEWQLKDRKVENSW